MSSSLDTLSTQPFVVAALQLEAFGNVASAPATISHACSSSQHWTVLEFVWVCSQLP